jgi:hypothetical protein
LAEDFDSELMGAFTDDGTTDQSSPEATEGTIDNSETTDLDTSSEPQGEDDLRSYLERTKAANPDQAAVIDRIHRELEGAWTPKLQQAAELRKQYEGVTPELAGWVRQLDQLAASSPAEAAAALMAEAQRLQGLQQAAAPVEEPDFATDYDREVWHEVQELKALKQTILAERNEAIVNAQFTELEKQVGEIPYEERHRVVQEMVKDGAPPSMARRYYRDLYFDKVAQKIRDEAAGIVTRKAGMAPPPSAVADRAGQGAPPPAASFDEDIMREFRARNLI